MISFMSAHLSPWRETLQNLNVRWIKSANKHLYGFLSGQVFKPEHKGQNLDIQRILHGVYCSPLDNNCNDIGKIRHLNEAKM